MSLLLCVLSLSLSAVLQLVGGPSGHLPWRQSSGCDCERMDLGHLVANGGKHYCEGADTAHDRARAGHTRQINID